MTEPIQIECEMCWGTGLEMLRDHDDGELWEEICDYCGGAGIRE